MQALLDEWRDELSRKPLGMSEADACSILEIAPDADGNVAEEDLKQARREDGYRSWHQLQTVSVSIHNLRKQLTPYAMTSDSIHLGSLPQAYRRLARRHHPDKVRCCFCGFPALCLPPDSTPVSLQAQPWSPRWAIKHMAFTQVELANLLPLQDPGGRDKFHAIQQAYERLMAGSAGGQGTRPGRIQLLLKVRSSAQTARRSAELNNVGLCVRLLCFACVFGQ